MDSKNLYTYDSRREYIVEVLQEALLLDLLVCEDEGDAATLQSGCSVQVLQVVE